MKNMALMGSSPTNLKCCERTLVSLILRMYFWALKCQNWLWLHLNCSVRCVISILWIWMPYCSGVLSSEEKHAKNAVVSSYLHRLGPGLPYTQKQSLLSSTEARFLRIWEYVWVLSENSSPEGKQPVFGTDNLLLSSGDSEQIWNLWYQAFIQGAAGRRSEILYCLIEKFSWIVKVNLSSK